MKEINKVFSLFFSEKAILMFVGLIRGKIAALFLGPAGVGLFGQAVALQEMVTQILTLGMGGGILKMVAEAQGKRDFKRLDQVISAFALVLLGLAAAVITAALFYANEISALVFASTNYSNHVFIILFGAVLMVLGNFVILLIQGFGRWKSLAVINITQGLASTVISLLTIPSFGLNGALASLVVTHLITLLMGLYLGYKNIYSTDGWRWRSVFPKADVWIELLQFIGVFSVIYLLNSAMSIWIRRAIIGAEGETANGYFQVAWSASTVFYAVFSSIIWNYAMPKVATTQKEENTDKVQNETLQIVLLSATPLTISLVLSAPEWVSLLYSADFAPATTVIAWQLFGRWLELARQCLNIAVVPRKLFRFFLTQSFSVLAIQVVFTSMALPAIGVEAASLAFLLAGGASIVPVYVYHRKVSRLVVIKTNFTLFLGGLILVALAAGIARFGDLDFLHRLITGCVLIGVFLAICARAQLFPELRNSLFPNREKGSE